MMFGKAFKHRQHYVFDYKPRYYDERKERIRNLEKKYRDEAAENDDETKIRLLKSNLKNDWIKNKRSATNRAVTIRMAIIVSILVGIVAYLFELHKLF